MWLRLRAFCLNVRESIANAGMRDGFEICSFQESREKSREKSGSTVRSPGKSWKSGGGKVFVFPLVSRECSRGRRDSHEVVWCLMDGYDGLVIDIYSCDRP